MRRVNSYDYLRVLAAFAVIFLHVSSLSLYNYNSIPKSDWLVGNAYDAIVRWCVPVFFMLSGAFLLDPKKEEDLTTFFKKRISKVFIPFLFWIVFYYFFLIGIDEKPFSIKQFPIDFLNNNIIYHLWYIYVLLGLYLITPIIKIIMKNSSKNLIYYFLILWFINGPIINLLDHLFNLNIFFDFAIDDFIGYFILGYVLRITNFSNKALYSIYTLAIICLFITFYGTYYDTVNNDGTFVGFYYHYVSPNITIISIAVFLLVKNLNIESLKINSIIQFISSKTFGIYLIHVVFLKILNNYFDINYASFNIVFSVPLISLLTFILCIISVSILQKMRV